MKGRRTISPLEPSDTTSRSVPRVSMATACSALMSPEMAGARSPSTDSGVNRMLSPVFCATLRRASDSGCSWMDILVSWAAAAALIDRTATLLNRTERKAPQRDMAMFFPSGYGHLRAAIGEETFGGQTFPTPLMALLLRVGIGGQHQGVARLLDREGKQLGQGARKGAVIAHPVD